MMEAKVLLLAAIILASGCTIPGNSNGNNANIDGSSSGKLEIVEFKPADSTLYPDQGSTIILKLRNNHISENVEIDNMELYNIAPLQVEESSCTPEELQPAAHGISPTMECQWRIRAPSSGEIGDFESKLVQPRLQLRYESAMSNKRNPLEVQFKPYENIRSPEEVTQTYSNGEIEMGVSVESPAQLEGTKVGLHFQNVGEGKVVPERGEDTDAYYDVEFLPDPVFVGGETCSGDPVSVTSPVGSDIDISCELNPGSDTAVARHLVFSTSYKYQRSPSLHIEVVNDQ